MINLRNLQTNEYMDTPGKIFFAIIMLHLLIGFGYVLYKLNGKQKPGK
jgi:hypothetical protein